MFRKSSDGTHYRQSFFARNFRTSRKAAERMKHGRIERPRKAALLQRDGLIHSPVPRCDGAGRRGLLDAAAENTTDKDAENVSSQVELPVQDETPQMPEAELPLEAQRLGLEAWASDLNPVAVTINKAMIEIPPKFAGRAPVGPIPPSTKTSLGMTDWKGAQGLAEDVRRYGHWMREEAYKRIGHLYPQVEITADMALERPDLQEYVGRKLTVIAWLWARTVKSPNPAFAHVDVPLASTFVLSSKAGKEAWVEPVVDGDSYRFTVRMGKPPEAAKNGTKVSSKGANFRCLVSGAAIAAPYVKEQGLAGKMGARLMAIVAEGTRGVSTFRRTRSRSHLPDRQNHHGNRRRSYPMTQEIFGQFLTV